MRLDKTFGTDQVLEEDGKWFDIGDNARVKIARFGCGAHKKALKRLREPYKALLLRGGEIPDEVNDGIINDAMSQTILVDWEGMLDENNEPIAYTPDVGLQTFKLYKDFLDLIFNLSMNAANFRSEMQEEIIKK